MSRAFVRESDDETVPLPDRPISSHRNFVTARGMAEIEANLNRFEAAYRSAVAQDDKQAVVAALREVRYLECSPDQMQKLSTTIRTDRVAFSSLATDPRLNIISS